MFCTDYLFQILLNIAVHFLENAMGLWYFMTVLCLCYIALTEAYAQDAGGSYFEHILLCTTSVAFGHWASLVSVSGTYGA